MNIKQIWLGNFASHKESTVDLPERGLVIVQGHNGSGKSALLEGVAASVWGKSLRGTALWREGEASGASIVSDLARVMRTRTSKGKASLSWEALDPADCAALRLQEKPLSGDAFENNTKAQERLEAIVGSFEVWKRTSVLSSSDAAHFALATDAERKQLLESVLGLDRFDMAHVACRTDLRKATADRDALTRDVEVARARLDGVRARCADAKKMLDAAEKPEDVAELKAKIAKLDKLKAESDVLLKDVRSRYRKLEGARADADAAARYARREADAIRVRMAEKTCTKCGQSVEHTHNDAAAELADAERRAALTGPSDAEEQEVDAEREELEDAAKAVEVKLAELRSRITHSNARKTAYQRAEALVDETATDLEKWSAKHTEAVELARTNTSEVEELTACEQVLGMRGVRATMLDRALGAVQAQANAWLQRLAFPGSITLSSTTERKSGSVVDAISLEVNGTGGGKYRGSSGGERRRIDVALLLGLAEVAAAARGGRRGTLFADELFDALDAEGVTAAAQALSDLARERCVIVITHSQELAEQLPAVLRLRVEAGVVVKG